MTSGVFKSRAVVGATSFPPLVKALVNDSCNCCVAHVTAALEGAIDWALWLDMLYAGGLMF